MEWSSIKEILVWLEPYLFIFIIATCAYTFVLILGRMFDLIHKYKIKNLITIIYIFGGMFIYFRFYRDVKSLFSLVMNIIIFGSFSSLFYMLFLWRLIDRTDALLDKWIGKDKGFKASTGKRTKKIKK